MKLVIPTYNRFEKLSRSLHFYKDLTVLQEIPAEIVVLDGSIDGSEIDSRQLCESLGIKYVFDYGSHMPDRFSEYLNSISPDEIIALSPDEDVFLPDFLEFGNQFLLDNADYSVVVGRYITFQKPLGCLHRVSNTRSQIIDLDINNSDSLERASMWSAALIAGCSPLFWGLRRAKAYKITLGLQDKAFPGATQELLDQACMCFEGNIRLVPNLMFIRDETKVGDSFVENHHNLEEYISQDDLRIVFEKLDLMDNRQLASTIKILLQLYKSGVKSPSFFSQWQRETYGKNEIHFFSDTGERSLLKIWRFMIRIVNVSFEIVKARLVISGLKRKYGRKKIERVLKMISVGRKRS
jgi:hypothetical protein